MASRFLTSLVVILVLIAGRGTSSDLECGEDGVFCLDVAPREEGKPKAFSPARVSQSPPPDVLFSLTIIRVKENEHNWSVWISEAQRSHPVSLHLLRKSGDPNKIAALHEHFQFIFEDPDGTIELSLRSNDTEPAPFSDYIVSREDGMDRINFTSTARTSQESGLNEQVRPAILIETAKGRYFPTYSDDPMDLFKGKIHGMHTGMPSWVWILLGVLGAVAVLVLLVLVVFGAKYAYVTRTSSKGRSSSFSSQTI